MRISRFAVVFPLLVRILASCPVSADCVDYPDYLHCVGSTTLPWGGPIAISDTYALVGGGGFEVIDLADRTHPRLLYADYENICPGVAVAGRYGYVASLSGFRVVDLSSTAAPLPAVVGAIDTPGPAYAVDVSGNYAYVGTCPYAAPGSFEIIDVTDPRAPQIVGHLGGLSGVRCLAVSGERAYVGTDTWLQVVDITDPFQPYLMGNVFLGSIGLDMAVSGHYVYWVGLAGFEVIDVADPWHPQFLASLFFENGGSSISISGSYAYVAAGGFSVIDIKDPLHPQIVGGDSSTEGSGLALWQDLAYVVSWWGGLYVFDVSNPRNPAVVGRLNTPDSSWGVAVSGTHAFLAGDPGFTVIDISSPTDPRVVADIAPSSFNVAVSGSLAFTVSFVGPNDLLGINVIDIADPESPSVIGQVETSGVGGQWFGLAASGPYVYLSSGEGYPGLQVIDATDPTNPTVVGSIELTGTNLGVAVSGTLVCVAGDRGLHLVDVSIPDHPRILSIVGDEPCDDVAIVEGRAYVSGRSLQVIDIANPSSPCVLGSLSLPRGGGPVAVSGPFAYVGSYSVQVIDVGDPSNPQLLGTICTGGANDIALSEFGLCAAGYDFWILPTQCDIMSAVATTPIVDKTPQLIAFPNPASGPTTIRFAFPAEGRVTTAICDVSGRPVRQLSAEVMAAGPYDLAWDGRDGKGRSVGSGVYVVKSTIRGQTYTGRVVLVR